MLLPPSLGGVRLLLMDSETCLCEQVDVGHVTSWLLSNLTALTEYTVGVFALYDEGQAEAVTDSFTTSRTPSLHLENVLQVSFR